MKSRILATLASFLIALPLAWAQGSAEKFHVNIPFDFYANSQLLPAGEYTVTFAAGSRVVSLSDGRGHYGRVIYVEDEKSPRSRASKNYLVFSRNSETCTLHMIGIAGDDHVHDILHEDTVADLTVQEAP